MSDNDYVFYFIFKYCANIIFAEHGGSLNLRFLVNLPSNKTDSPSLLLLMYFKLLKSALIPFSSIHYTIHVKCLMS